MSQGFILDERHFRQVRVFASLGCQYPAEQAEIVRWLVGEWGT